MYQPNVRRKLKSVNLFVPPISAWGNPHWCGTVIDGYLLCKMESYETTLKSNVKLVFKWLDNSTHQC